MELTNLQQVSECNVGCCNSAGDMHLKGHTQANQSAFEYRAQNNRTGHCTINSMSLKKLGVFLDHVKAEIFRLDSLNPSGNPRKRIKSPSLQYVPAALSTTNSLTPYKDKLRFPGDQSTGAALQALNESFSHRYEKVASESQKEGRMNRFFTWSTSN